MTDRTAPLASWTVAIDGRDRKIEVIAGPGGTLAIHVDGAPPGPTRRTEIAGGADLTVELDGHELQVAILERDGKPELELEVDRRRVGSPRRGFPEWVFGFMVACVAVRLVDRGLAPTIVGFAGATLCLLTATAKHRRRPPILACAAITVVTWILATIAADVVRSAIRGQ